MLHLPPPPTESKHLDKQPKTLLGTVCKQWVRCGKSRCRYARGELHGPYFYRFWRDGGRVRKTYVKRSDVDTVTAQCAARQQRDAEARQALNELPRQRDLWVNVFSGKAARL